MFPHRLRTALLIALLLATASGCFATAITYTFVGTAPALPGQPPVPIAFQLTVDDFVSPPTDGSYIFFDCDQLDSNTNCGYGISFSTQSAPDSFDAQVLFSTIFEAGYTFDFPSGAFTVPGTYTSDDNTGTLTVTGISDVPEPSSASFIAMGLLGAFGYIRRKLY